MTRRAAARLAGEIALPFDDEPVTGTPDQMDAVAVPEVSTEGSDSPLPVVSGPGGAEGEATPEGGWVGGPAPRRPATGRTRRRAGAGSARAGDGVSAAAGGGDQAVAGDGGPSDRAFHLARVCAGFPTSITPRSAERLARLLAPAVAPDQSGAA